MAGSRRGQRSGVCGSLLVCPVGGAGLPLGTTSLVVCYLEAAGSSVGEARCNDVTLTQTDTDWWSMSYVVVERCGHTCVSWSL